MGEAFEKCFYTRIGRDKYLFSGCLPAAHVLLNKTMGISDKKGCFTTFY